MKLTFHGHACFEVEASGHRVVIDPFLSQNPVADIGPESVQVEAILLTHGHGDHIADAEVIARKNNAVIVAPNEVALYFGSKGLTVHPMGNGGKWTFPFGTVKLTLAFHGAGLDADGQILHGGNPAGILLTMGDQTFYHAGDTALFGDMRLIGDLNHIDAAALPIGDNFTMGPEDAVLAAQWIHAGVTIPIHYNTFDLIRQDGGKFVESLAAHGLKGHVMEPGSVLEI
ncbi:MAG: metal-dependent hydrolase [Alicyclobacillus sp.]|nr:metal-dependent hydrolase [Alicyclobacillus sp.]